MIHVQERMITTGYVDCAQNKTITGQFVPQNHLKAILMSMQLHSNRKTIISVQSIACECDTQTTVNSMNHKKAKDYSPVVLVEVLTNSGVWKNAKCLLDGGSNWSLVRTGFAGSADLEDIGPSNASTDHKTCTKVINLIKENSFFGFY